MSRVAPAWVRVALPFVLDALLVVASFYPQSIRPRDTVAYVGDSLESVYILAWNVHQFFRSPAHLFDANVLHPHQHSLAFTDHRLLPSLIAAPVLWATGNAVLAYNVAVALACLLAAFGARCLARALGAGPAAAWAAGALYAFNTYQVNEAPRLNMIFHGFIPLALAQLVVFFKTGSRTHAWAVAGLMLLQGLSSNYHLLYGSLVLGLVTIGVLLARPRQTARRLPQLALAGVVAAALFAPLAIPYVRMSSVYGFARELPVGIDLQHYFSTSPGNLLYGAIGADVRLQQRGPHFAGFVSLLLAGIGVLAWALGRGRETDKCLVSSKVWVPAATVLALLFVALSLGRDMVAFGHAIGPGPYRLLYRWVPGFQLVRIPERLGLFAMLFLALLVARGVTLLPLARTGWLAWLLAALVALEHVSTLTVATSVPVGRRVPQVYGWLARNPTGAVAEVPVRGEGLVRQETLEMYFSSFHWKPLIHGYTAFPPLLARLLRRLAAEFPSAATLQAFRRVNVDTVVVHHGRPVGQDLAWQVDNWGPADDSTRLERLLSASDLSLYDKLPAAVTSGRVVRAVRFEGAAAQLYESTADEVYRLAPAERRPAAPLPVGRRLRDPAWNYRTKIGDPAPAADGNLATAWIVPRALRGDEFFEIVFDRPLAVAGLVLPLRRDSAFPTRFRIAGRDGAGRWAECARFDEGHALQLVDQLLKDPGRAVLGFDLGGRELTGISLLVEAGGTSFDGWSLPEVEVWVPGEP